MWPYILDRILYHDDWLQDVIDLRLYAPAFSNAVERRWLPNLASIVVLVLISAGRSVLDNGK